MNLFYLNSLAPFGFTKGLSWDFPCGSDSEGSACNAGDSGLTLERGRPLEEEMAVHCSILASRIPWTEEPGGLQPDGHD